MKSKFILAGLALILLLVPGCALVSDDAKTPATNSLATDIATLKAQAATFTADIASLKEQINKKADINLVDALTKMVSGGAAGSSNSYTKTETYTQQQVNDQITAAINNLKNDQSWIKAAGAGGGSGSNPNSGTGTVTVLTNPTSVQVLGNQQVCYTAKIQNTTGQWAYVRPTITINAASGQSPTVVTALAISAGGSIGNLGTANFQFIPTLPSASPINNITCVPISGGTGTGEFQIAAGAIQDILICIQITSANPIIWNIGTTVGYRNL